MSEAQHSGDLLGICKNCQEPVYDDYCGNGYMICETCQNYFHVEECLQGRYLDGLFWCQECVDDGKHVEICPHCGQETKDFTELDDHNMCHDCMVAWQHGEPEEQE